MKSTTDARIARIVSSVSSHLTNDQLSDLVEALEYGMKEQDRDTRHACAEAVNAVYDGSLVMTRVEIINRAHAACMNVQAV